MEAAMVESWMGIVIGTFVLVIAATATIAANIIVRSYSGT
jgi:hypothetical protein